MSKIGFSTGCFYGSAANPRDAAIFFLKGGANAIELCFSTLAELSDFKLDEKTIEAVKKFSFISLHAPWKEIRYGANPQTEKIIGSLEKICKALPIKGIVVHPDIIDDFSPLINSGLPFLLENMDKRKTFGTKPEDFIFLKNKCNFGFVLNLQHAYESDPLMETAREFIMVMGERLHHFHVSGHSEGKGHNPIYLSKNCEAIAEILKMKMPVPKILEGVLMENPLGTMTAELAFVKKFEQN